MTKLKSIISWMPCLLFLASMAACSDDSTSSGIALEGPDIDVDPVMVRFNDAQTATVSVSYEGKWRAELSDDSWCSIDKKEGTGNDVITVTATGGNRSELQVAKLTIRAVDHPLLLKTVQLVRSGENFYVDPLEMDYGLGDDMTQIVKVGCPGAWTAKLNDDCTWCTIDKTSGNGEDSIRITSHLSLNPANVADATLTITSNDNPEQSVTVKLTYQEKYLHGSLITLNKATKGKGINLIVTGDGFTEADMGKDGRWKDIMDRSLAAIFRFEPYASFREYFNVYAVTAVSETSEILNDTPSNTFYGVYYENGGNASGALNNQDFIIEHTPVKGQKIDLRNVTILMVINDDKHGGVASLGSPAMGIACVWETSDNPINLPENMFPTLLVHEFLGHAFAKFGDEYYVEGMRIPEEEVKKCKLEKQAYGYHQNVEFTDDPNQFDNPYWRQMIEMNYPGVDVIEGGIHYGAGVWRSSQNSMMNNQTLTPFFSPVQREIIYRKIHELAGLPYSFDEFIEWDKKNLN